MKRWNGIAASPGIVTGPVWVYHPVKIEIVRKEIGDPAAEWTRLQQAIAVTSEKIAAVGKLAFQQAGEKEAAIFDAHLMFLKDPEFLESIRQEIYQRRFNAEAAVDEAAIHFEKMLLALEDAYFRERAQDIRDVAGQLIASLMGVESGGRGPERPAIVAAEELTPADTIQFDKACLLGLVTRRGGPTSHTVILARSLGIPAVVSVPFPLAELSRAESVILDGTAGSLTVDPEPAVLADAQRAQRVFVDQTEAAMEAGRQPAVTLDGVRVEVSANIGSSADAVQAVQFGAEGVGLFRTEFMYMDGSGLPSEEAQVQVYRQVFAIMGPRPVVVRTVDIGGDKEIPYLGLSREANPFLGWRGIRMISERPDILGGQLRALLQAGVDADLRIMFPMVSNLDEIEQARQLLEKVGGDLEKEGKPVARKVQFGIMVEVPSIALVARHAAKLVDFFSIGTNDLTQYTLAADRGNERVAELASPYHPAVLQLIHQTIQAGQDAGKWVGMCGEFAGDPLAAPLLLGLGLDEFSASAPLLPALKQVLRRCRMAACRTLAEEALAQGKAAQVRGLCQEFARTQFGS
jgi:phosphoenolpyruvate-protein phosphotransferase